MFEFQVCSYLDGWVTIQGRFESEEVANIVASSIKVLDEDVNIFVRKVFVQTNESIPICQCPSCRQLVPATWLDGWGCEAPGCTY